MGTLLPSDFNGQGDLVHKEERPSVAIIAMAYYKNANFLSQEFGPEFDIVHTPGVQTPFSGIYRCTGCGKSITSTHLHPLPAQNHEQHPPGVPIRWQLIVKSHFR